MMIVVASLILIILLLLLLLLLIRDNFSPPHAQNQLHDFQMTSFSEPTICDVCRKLLRWVHCYL